MISKSYHMIRMIAWVPFITLLACEPQWEEPYEVFVISKNTHGSFDGVQFLQSKTLRFTAVFDESAVYTSDTEENQHDVNKLLGFADCNSHHHKHSARFGWRWLEDQLEILAYSYVNGERIIKPVGFVGINESNDYRITLTKDEYEFQLGSFPVVTVDRESDCEKGAYYMLFPYFGGNETAPHDITIKILIKY